MSTSRSLSIRDGGCGQEADKHGFREDEHIVGHFYFTLYLRFASLCDV